METPNLTCHRQKEEKKKPSIVGSLGTEEEGTVGSDQIAGAVFVVSKKSESES